MTLGLRRLLSRQIRHSRRGADGRSLTAAPPQPPRSPKACPPPWPRLTPKIPSGPLADKWRKHKAEIKLVNPPTSANTRSSSWARVWAAPAAATLAETGLSGEMLRVPRQSATGALDRPRRAASTRPRTTRTTGDSVYSPAFTTRSRAATTARARPTPTGSPRSRRTSSTSASRRAGPSPREYSGLLGQPAPSAAPKVFAHRSTRGARPGSRLLARGSAPRCRAWWASGMACSSSHKAKCSTSWWWTATPRASWCGDLVTGEVTRARG